MITIGQLARYAGVSRKTIRVYHAKGLLPEPDRDASGYRRYTARDVIEVLKIRTLAHAGVPLARIRELRSATDDEFRRALSQLDDDLTGRTASFATRSTGCKTSHWDATRCSRPKLPRCHTAPRDRTEPTLD